jgi:predicted nuclease of predicted toxin-antitoxin system
MRFLIDAQLPPALARWIDSREGHSAEHVADLEMMEEVDRAIWTRAQETSAVVISKDADFVTLYTLEPDGPAVVWIRLGNTRKQALLQWFESLFPEILSSLEQGERLIEIN